MSGYTQALAFDEADGHLLMADEEGIVRHLDLDRGTTAVLLDPPRRLGIIQLLLSDDRHGLCCVCRPLMDRRQGPPSVQIWNHRLLAERRLRVISPNA
jgi:hypothetical protein